MPNPLLRSSQWVVRSYPTDILPPIDTLQSIQIADGVEIQLKPAGPVPRAFAWVFDKIFQLLIIVVLVVLFLIAVAGLGISGMNGDLGEVIGGMGAGLGLVVLFFLEWGYHTFFETRKSGASPGKRIMGLRVTKISGAQMSLRDSLLRNLLRPADMAPGFAGLVGLGSMLFTKRFQRLGDLLADSLVIYGTPKDRVMPPPLVPPLLMPALPDMEPTPPPMRLQRDEQQALTEFAERLQTWSLPRQIEIANHLAPMTQHEGTQGVQHLKKIARWIKES